MRHHKGWDCLEITTKTALRLEALAKGRIEEHLAELGEDPAADIDAAARAERQRQVARHRSEHRAEHYRRLDTQWVLGADRQIGDLRRRIPLSRHAIDDCKNVVKIDEPGAR